ncbi:MAG: hypothetical protein C5B51_17710 [Terriglobia bacterium]|nr:MAG: hypothetical protein C5B51_17710 [Terriglobia bacterium]
MKSLAWLLGGLIVLSARGVADPLPPPTIIFSRPLPTANLNNVGTQRSNYAFTEFDPNNPFAFEKFDGDDFTLNTSNNAYIVQSISTWSVASTPGQALGVEFASVSLYMRPVYVDPITHARSPLAPFSIVATGAPNQNFQSDGVTVGNSNPNITHTNVHYADGENYESVNSPGTFYPLWQNTFSNLNLVLASGVTYEFAVWGLGHPQTEDPNTMYGYWFNEYSNAGSSGNAQDGSDNFFLSFDANNLDAVSSYVNAQQAGLGPKPVDLNVQIVGIGVPEPTTFGLLGIGLIALGYFSRKRR